MVRIFITAAILLGFPAAAGGQTPAAQQDEPVGWPLKKAKAKDAPLPEKIPPLVPSGTDEGPEKQNSPPARPFEVAPLEIIRPPISPLRFVYPQNYIAFTVQEGEALSKLALRLIGTEDRILITAYAGGDNAASSNNDAVKLSFRRALIVRGFLIEEGVLPEQIDLKALGVAGDGGPEERVDIRPISP